MLMLFFVYSVFNENYAMRKYKIECPRNPTAFVLDFSREKVKEVIDSLACNVYNGEESDYKYNWEFKGMYGLGVKFWDKNQINIYYKCNAYSYAFRKNGEFFRMNPLHSVKLDSIKPYKTRILVTSLHSPDIEVGYYYLPNPRTGEFKIPRMRKVSHTTIEEYELIRYIGKVLGQSGMPPIRYPSIATMENIRRNYTYLSRAHFPFTPEEFQIGEK